MEKMTRAPTALILSAGFSSRMGSFKPLLPLGGITVLERSVSLFRSAGVDDIRVVTGHRSAELEPLLKRLGVRTILNIRYREGMFSSVIAGTETLGADVDSFFILPVDLPLIRPVTIRWLLRERALTESDVLYPCFQGRRGHPPLISGKLAGSIASWSGVDGLRGALAQWEGRAREIEVPDEHILNDMDTPESYVELTKKVKHHEIPTEAECMAMLGGVYVDPEIISHCRTVANLATLLARKLNRAGYQMDINLLTAAALLHDLARTEPNHARAGANMLREAGFGKVGDLVAEHMDITASDQGEIRPMDLLYLADKISMGDRHVTLTERFQKALERYSHDPDISRKVAERLKQALTIQTRLESTLGCSLAEMIRST